ncbi:MAG: TIGR01459 family HAD-type hydrolase [Parachlamydiaceae bacterium]|nr:TIGR01459 family HAD-type hydrolase [Parachlamydiaceae bacterium]
MSESIKSTCNPKVFPHLESISEPFDGILLDAYGVFWGGNDIGILPGCQQTMERLVSEGKIIGILSNSTQLEKKEIEKLKNHGLELGKHFHFFITSGTVAKQIFLTDNLPFPIPNKKFYLFGMPHPKFNSHQMLFQDTLFQETTNLQEADFIYISIPHIDGHDQTDPLIFKEYIETFKDTHLPMVCVNPDLFAHEGNPPRAVVRQGSIAAMHIEQGGQVFYVGKPSDKMFLAAMKSFLDFGISNPQKVLMVGDTPETDIRGARNFGIPSALITKTGIMADRINRLNLESAVRDLPINDFPDFFIDYMGKK